MQNFTALDGPGVTLSQSKQNLHEDFPNNVLCYEVFLRLALFYKLCHVSIFTVLHDNVDFLVVPMNDLFHIFDDVGVVQFTKAVNLADYLRPFFFREMTIIDFLPAVQLVLVLAGLSFGLFDLVNTTVRALTDFFNDLVSIHF